MYLDSHIDRCHEIEGILEPLFVFSSKLKHFQLSYKQYTELVAEFFLIQQHHKGDRSVDEYYLMQLERMIMEMLTQIPSIRDCLKNKILATDSNNNVNGKLCDKYNVLQKENIKNLSETFDKDDVSESIRDLTENLRHKLTHSSLQKTKFLEVLSQPKYGPHSQTTLLVCDYPHFTERILGLDSKNHDFVWRYYLDHHIMSMQQGVLASLQLDELKRRVNALGVIEYWVELCNNISAIEEPLIRLDKATHDSVMMQRHEQAHIPVYDRLLACKE